MPRAQAGRVLDYQTAPARAPGRYLPLSLFALAALLADRRLRTMSGGSEPPAEAPDPPAGPDPAIAGGETGMGRVPVGIGDLVRRLLGRQVRVFVAGRTGAFAGTLAGRTGSLIILSARATPLYIDLNQVTAIGALPADRFGRPARAQGRDWDEEAAYEEEEEEMDGWFTPSGRLATGDMMDGADGDSDSEWELESCPGNAAGVKWADRYSVGTAQEAQGAAGSGRTSGVREGPAAGLSSTWARAAAPMNATGAAGTPGETVHAGAPDSAVAPDSAALPGGPPTPGEVPTPGAAPGAAGQRQGAVRRLPLAVAPRCGRNWQLIHVYRPSRRS